MTRIGDIGTPALITKNEKLAYYVSLALFKVYNLVVPNFLYYYIQSCYFQKELWRRTLHIAFPKKINKNEIEECRICYPKRINEQQKISIFLSLIDFRIETQSKIIEDLKTFKKSICLSILGDKSNIKKKWQIIKLSEILKERKTYDVKESVYKHVTLSKDGIFEKSDRYNRDFLVKDEEKQYKITHLNDICYNPANLKFGVICLNDYGDAIFSPIYVTYTVNDGNDPYFIALYVTNPTFIGHIRKYEQGTVYERMAVSSSDFLKGKIYLPNLQVQKYISSFFKNIDLKINLETKILEKYKKQKKYLLANMFI